MKILVADDEALLVKGIRFNLQSDGYDVYTASNGQEAVHIAMEVDIDLVILDVMMPVMDGLPPVPRSGSFPTFPSFCSLQKQTIWINC